MNAITRITEVLYDKYGFYVPLAEIGYENYAFTKLDIDENIVPNHILKNLVEPIETESANYTDTAGNYYLVIQVDVGKEQPYEVWMVNDEVQHEFLDELK